MDKNQIIFIHIPKCAGKSLVKILYGEDIAQHCFWSDFFSFDRYRYKSYLKLSVVRDPVARCYSAYSYLRNGGSAPTDLVYRQLFIRKYQSFDDFVSKGLEFCIQHDIDHFIPQHKYIYDNDQLAVDRLYKLEELHRATFTHNSVVYDFSKMCEVNSSKNDDGIADESIDKIKLLYAEDYRLLNY